MEQQSLEGIEFFSQLLSFIAFVAVAGFGIWVLILLTSIARHLREIKSHLSAHGVELSSIESNTAPRDPYGHKLNIRQ